MRVKAAIVVVATAWAAGIVASHAALAQVKSQWDGVYTDAQAKRGAAVYGKECQECHGELLEGKGEAPSLAGSEFAAAWNELTINDLFERIRKSMPKETPGSLTRPQYADVIAFVLSRNDAPSGKAELPDTADGLKGIIYKMTK
jgi:mono/diheme cytochrome c family protein